MIDVSLAIEHIYYAAEYFGSLTANTEQAFNDLRWLDARPKPTWQEVLAAWEEMNDV